MTKKHVLLSGVSALAMGMMMVPAVAQDDTVETVVVTGIRASLQSAQAIKQNADQVVDSITAVDIGALPDSSVAEALQRVPGVQITRTDQVQDPLRWAGFGNGVFIRGLSWVSSLTNGHETFGAENGRTISFADISADLMAGVDVYKNPTAKMIEGGVGGVVDLKTRVPFDHDGQVFAVSSNLSYGSQSEKFAPAINMVYSNRWSTKIGEIGVLLSADYQDLRASNNVVSTDAYRASATVDGSTVYYPWNFKSGSRGMVGYRHMDWTQPRLALDATVQWRPNDKLELTLTAIFSKASPQSGEHNVAWRVFAPGSTHALNYTYDAAGTWNGGTFENAETGSTLMNYFDTRFDVRHHINASYTATLKYNPTDRLEITLDAQYVDSRAYMYSMTMYNMFKNPGWCVYGKNGWNQGQCINGNTSASHSTSLYYPDAPSLDVTVDLHDDSPKITYAGDVDGLADQSNYLWSAAMDHVENNYAHSYASRADATYTFDENGLFGWIKSVDFGARVSLKNATSRRSRWGWGRISFETWKGWTSSVTGAQAATAYGDFSTVNTANTSYYKFPNLFGTSMPGKWEPSLDWLKSGIDGVWAGVQAIEAGEVGVGTLGNSMWSPLSILAGCSSGVEYRCMGIYSGMTGDQLTAAGNGGGINAQSEDTYAGYLQFNYVHDTFLGFDVPVDGNIGLRVVNTKTDSGVGYLLLPKVAACEASSDGDCTDKNNAIAFVGATNSYVKEDAAAVTHNYTDFLPSMNLRAHLTDQLQLRLAYSKGIVRPEFSKTQNYTVLGFNFMTDTGYTGTFATAYGGKTGSAGNPNLKPLYASNYDISLEWFFSPTGNVALAMFHKDITNYVMSSVVKEAYTHNNITYDFYLTKYINGDKGKVEGFEIAYTQFYDQLPGAWSGLGFQANYTKIYNSGGSNATSNITDSYGLTNATNAELPMEGMSNDSFNIALMYAKYGIDARLAYNWRSRFLVASSAANVNQPVWQRNYGQLDASVIYSFLDHYKVGFQVNNVFKQTTVLETGEDMSYMPKYEWVEGERKMSLVFRASW